MSPEMRHLPQQSNKSDQFSQKLANTEQSDNPWINERGNSAEEHKNVTRILGILIDKSKDPDNSVILGTNDAIALINDDMGRDATGNFIWYINKFQDLDYASIANEFIDSKKTSVSVLLNMYLEDPSVPVLNYSELVDKLIKKNNDRDKETIYRFHGLSHIDIANRLIKASEANEVEPADDDFNEFQNLDQDVADRLIEAGHGVFVLMHFDEFQDIDCINMIEKLIITKNERSVIIYIDNIPATYHADVAKMLIDAGYGSTVGDRLSNFKNLDASVAYKLIENGQGVSVLCYPRKFPDLDPADFVDRMIIKGEGLIVVRDLNTEWYRKIDRTDTAIKLIKNNQMLDVINNLDNEFKNVSRAVIAKTIIETGQAHYITDNVKSFPNINKELLGLLQANNQ